MIAMNVFKITEQEGRREDECRVNICGKFYTFREKHKNKNPFLKC